MTQAEKNVLLNISAIIAAGIVSRPGSDYIHDPEKTAKKIVAIAKALIKECEPED